MKKFLSALGIIGIIALVNFPALAEKATPPIQPTPSAKPLPTLKETNNIDVVLNEKVQAAIAKTPILKGQPVTASAYNRIIMLQGSVASKAQERAAIKAAYSVKGVKKVNSHLTIRGGGK